MPNGPDAKLRHWGRVDDVLMIRFSGEIAAPAAAVWDIIRDGSRRSELDELLDQSCATIRARPLRTGAALTLETYLHQSVWRCVCRRRLEDLSPLISVWQFDFKPVMMTAPRSFVTIGFSVKLPVCPDRFS